MNRCPITYQPCGEDKYTQEGLRLLNRNLETLQDFPYSSSEQRLEAANRMGKMSIQGVQPKLSAVLNVRRQSFEIVEKGGLYIIKPQQGTYAEMPENEDVTMRLARLAGIETPLHGLFYCKDGSLSYFIKRFDRIGRKEKLATEDFSQLAGLTPEAKYDYTIEKMIGLIEQHCTFPAIEKYKFFRLILFCFLTGNEDMHLKNFSLITLGNGIVAFSPAYDMLNSTLILGGAEEEMALMLAGRRKVFRRKELVEYLGKERLQLSNAAIDEILTAYKAVMSEWTRWIEISFLSESGKEGYLKILSERFARLFA